MRELGYRLLLAAALLAATGCDEAGSSDADADTDTDVDSDADTDTDTGKEEWTPPDRDPVNPQSFDAAAITEDEGVFPAGVIAGEPQPTSMLLWTQADQTENLRLKVWLPGIDPADASRVDLLYDEAVTPSDLGFVHQRVEAVVPGRRHEYAFFVEATPGSPTARSRIGSFLAAPPEGALTRLTLSGTHGTHHKEAPYPNLVKNAELEPFAIYIHTGDSVYADGATTRADYHEYWLDNWQTAGFRAVLEDAVYLPVWDDHEVKNNFNPETIDPAQLQAGIDAFFDYNPMARFPNAPNRYWRTWRWGDTVEFFALDCRSERKPSTRDRPDAEYISVAQMTWFKDALSSSTAVFKIVLDSVPIMNLDPKIWMTVGDSWRGYPAQRDELIEFMVSEELENVFFVTGDFHMATVGRLEAVGTPGDHIWEFMLGPGAQDNPLGDREAIIETVGQDFDPLPPPQFRFGYPKALLSYVDLNPLVEPPQLTIRYYDTEDGHALYRATIAAGELEDEEPPPKVYQD